MIRKVAPFTLIALLLSTYPYVWARQASEWKSAGAQFQMEAAGRAVDPDGATVTLRSSTAPALTRGSVTSEVSAEGLRGRRVTLSAELQTQGVRTDARLELSAGGASGPGITAHGFDDRLTGDTGWTPRTLSLVVPANATTVTFGILLRGSGEAAARHVRFTVGLPLTAESPVAPQAKQVLDAAIELTKVNALRGRAIDWTVIEPEMRRFAAGATRASDVYPAIVYLLRALDDNHGSFWSPGQWSLYSAAQTRGDNTAAEVKSLADRIGYIALPSYAGATDAAAREYVSRLHESMLETMPRALCGWVVSLRKNGGGNVWPMLAGLKPFLGDDPLGGSVASNGARRTSRGEGIDVVPPLQLGTLASVPVAVLIGSQTMSAGEGVALAFRGRRQSRSFGQPSGGFTTSVETYPLPDGAMLSLAVGVMTDRSGRSYGGQIEPDESVGAPPAGTASLPNATDETLERAVIWLRQAFALRMNRECGG